MRAAKPGDPTAVTRHSYNLIAADYARRNADPTGEWVVWRDEWVAAVLATSPVGLAPTSGGGPAAMAEAFPPRVLDVGAGPGQHTAAFVAAGLHAVAFDLSPAMAAFARGRGVPAVLGDLRRLPFADGAFDGVWSSAWLLHVPRDEVPATLREWHRVTRPGGLIAIATASGGTDGWEDPPYDAGGERPPPRWFVYHDPDELTALLADAGWELTEPIGRRESLRVWLQIRARRR